MPPAMRCLHARLTRDAFFWLAAGAESAEDQARFAATFEDVYSADALQVPWYITSGYMDWEGNVTGAPRFCPTGS